MKQIEYTFETPFTGFMNLEHFRKFLLWLSKPRKGLLGVLQIRMEKLHERQ